MADQKNQPSTLALVAILLLLTIGFRIVQLEADPPADLDWSGGYFADEGYWSHNARNAALFGAAVQDEWDGRAVSPLFCYFQESVFKIAGPGIKQVRIIGLLSAILIAVAAFFLFRAPFGDLAAFAISIVVSLNFPLLVLARQGILDPVATALSITALLLLCRNSTPAWIAAGLLFAGSVFTKFFMLYTAPCFLAAALLSDHSEAYRSRRRTIIAFSTGVAIGCLAWLFWNYLPNRDVLNGYNEFYSSQQAQQNWQAVEVIKNIVMQPFYLYMVKTPVILFFGNLMVWCIAVSIKDSRKIEKIIWIWLVCGILFFALWRYRPLRYYTSLIPPLAALAAIAFIRMQLITDALQSRSKRLWLLAGIAIPFLQITFLLFDRIAGWQIIPEQLGIHTFDAVVFLAITVAGTSLLLTRKFHLLAVVFAVGFIISDLRNYTSWMINPQYSALEISTDLKRRLPGNAVLSGQWAPELALENGFRVVPVWKGFVNSEHPFEKYGITHLLLWRYPLGDEYVKFTEWYPENMKYFDPVKRYRIKDSELLLMENRLMRKTQ